MVKLTGQAKAAFLNKMATGRARAARRRNEQPPPVRPRPPRRRRRAKPGSNSDTKKYTKKPKPRPPPEWFGSRKNPSLLTITNPKLLTITNPTTRSAIAGATRKYRRFHGQAPRRVVRLKKGTTRKDPLILIGLGRAVEIIYEPRSGHRRRIQWFHEFGRDAVLAVSEDGKRLFIVNAKGRVLFDFSRGITG